MTDLLNRYLTDPFFKALVDKVEPGGFTDDDGCHHEGPTMAGARRVQEYLDAIAELGYKVVRVDREPQPSDGPDYHADLAAWKRRQLANCGAPGRQCHDEATHPHFPS